MAGLKNSINLCKCNVQGGAQYSSEIVYDGESWACVDDLMGKNLTEVIEAIGDFICGLDIQNITSNEYIPDSEYGKDGDVHITIDEDNDTAAVYQKKEGVWVAVVIIPTGGGGAVAGLQEVTDIGATTDNIIEVRGIHVDEVITIPTQAPNPVDLAGGKVAIWADASGTSGNIPVDPSQLFGFASIFDIVGDTVIDWQTDFAKDETGADTTKTYNEVYGNALFITRLIYDGDADLWRDEHGNIDISYGVGGVIEQVHITSVTDTTRIIITGKAGSVFGEGANQVRTNTQLDQRYLRSMGFRDKMDIDANYVLNADDYDKLIVITDDCTITIENTSVENFPVLGRVAIRVALGKALRLEVSNGVTLHHGTGDLVDTGYIDVNGFTFRWLIHEANNEYSFV